MKLERAGRLLLFEPWSLGDVVIAASVLRELPTSVALACHTQWHPILKSSIPERPDIELIGVDFSYTTRSRTSPFDNESARSNVAGREFNLVLSIRGDPRDYAAARRLFPKARIRMIGWVRFLAWKSALLNAPFALGLARVQNRYRSWADLAGIPFPQIEQTYRRLQTKAPVSGRIAIHIGAQWRSKQFPQVAALRGALEAEGWEVAVLAGPNDPLPPDVQEADVTRATGTELVAQLKSVEEAITNDSCPMHLAAFLGCRTTVLVRTSPIEEWVPPMVNVIASPSTPRGYRPHPDYMSDKVLPDWPTVDTISERLQTRACATGSGTELSATAS
ncbi:MAG: glycosyltransferase family 9 protein [Chthoniobacterales bacterium]